MTLSAGSRLGPYEILSPLGAGGMGEVYRARDTRLDRTVAIKVLPEGLAADAQLRERFEREARAISALQHPHICALFDVGRDGDHEFLVLEYLEGETLADRIARAGALPVGDALTIAIEICDALAQAHRSGIVHRDLKPANVMLTRAGAKLLDFGLAKAAGPVVAGTPLSMLPTTPPNITAQGTILGTLQYMAPEQLEGLEADTRTDTFALGALTFEMITGRPPFEGKTRASLLGAILKDEPPRLSQLQPRAPAALDRLIATCLAKDPEDRYQSARDLLRDLKWISSNNAVEAAAAPGRVRAPLAPWIVAAVLFVALLADVVLRFTSTSSARSTAVQFTVGAPEQSQFGGPSGSGTLQLPQVALSPDGRFVAFVATRGSIYQLWVRPLSALTPTAIAATDDASLPFWSPDSRFIGFFTAGKLKIVDVNGGAPIAVCDAAQGRGGTWNADNVIVFGRAGTGPLLRVNASGGAPTSVTTLDAAYGEVNHRFPHFLPDGRHFLYTAITGALESNALKPSLLKMGSLDRGDRKSVV